MSFLDKVTALIPTGRKKEKLEYFFALNIGHENLNCALWTIEGKQLKLLQTSSAKYLSVDELTSVADRLLDEVLGVRDLDPQKILFGVPSSWLSDENLKEENIKILRKLVKDLELTPMAYVESSHALIHFLEKTEGVPPTAVLVGFEAHHLSVTVVRAGKLDGVKVVSKGENSAVDIEKALLTFAAVETLPSKIYIYGSETEHLKNQLLSYPWMTKLSFLHFPKIETMSDEIEIKSVCFAGASEIEPSVSYHDKEVPQATKHTTTLLTDDLKEKEEEHPLLPKEKSTENLGFMVGDISAKEDLEQLKEESEETERETDSEEAMDEDYLSKHPESEQTAFSENANLIETDDFDKDLSVDKKSPLGSVVSGLAGAGSLANKFKGFSFKRFLPRNSKGKAILFGVFGIFIILLVSFLVLPKAEIKIFVEPKILERDTTVTADPNQKTIDEEKKIIPGQIVDTEVSGTSKAQATGEREVGNPAKGTVVIYNKTFDGKTLSRGTTLTGSGGIKFTLDSSVNIASQSATDSGITFGKTNATLTASVVGADSNLASGSELTVAGFTNQQISAKAEGNFSGGTSKKVTVVSTDDQNKLLATLASNLRKEAQQKLQESLPEKKILEEALSEEITRKSFNKNINDQANEFSLNLTNRYKGTAFEDKDLKTIVSKLVVTQVPDGFQLNLEDTETQADVSKIEKGGKLIFLAKFKAKLMPKIDTEKVKDQIKGKGVNEAIEVIKGMENILGAEVRVSPSIPFLQRIPILTSNIKVEVGLK